MHDTIRTLPFSIHVFRRGASTIESCPVLHAGGGSQYNDARNERPHRTARGGEIAVDARVSPIYRHFFVVVVWEWCLHCTDGYTHFSVVRVRMDPPSNAECCFTGRADLLPFFACVRPSCLRKLPTYASMIVMFVKHALFESATIADCGGQATRETNDATSS
jgi:hypothetical protein